MVSEECFDFLSKLLHPIAAKRLSLQDAWLHPWISKFKKKIVPISRPRAFESFKAIISYSLNTSKLFQLASYYISRHYMLEFESTYYFQTYLFFDRAHLGIIQVSDLKRVLLEGELFISDADLLFFCKRLGLPSIEEHIGETQINGFYLHEFLMFLTRDMDVFTYHQIKYAFDFFDWDKNGLITVEDFKKAIEPHSFNYRTFQDIFYEVSAVIGSNVVMTGINL